MLTTWTRVVLIIAFVLATSYTTHRVNQERIQQLQQYALDLCRGLNEGITETNAHGAILRESLQQSPTGSDRTQAAKIHVLPLNNCDVQQADVDQHNQKHQGESP